MNRASLKASAESSESDHWTLRPPADVRRLVARAIKDRGRNKAFWICECIRLGLADYAAKRDAGPSLLSK